MPEFLDDRDLPKTEKPTARTWLKKLGVAGFLFFFLKGMVWLAIFFGIGKGCGALG